MSIGGLCVEHFSCPSHLIWITSFRFDSIRRAKRKRNKKRRHFYCTLKIMRLVWNGSIKTKTIENDFIAKISATIFFSFDWRSQPAILAIQNLIFISAFQLKFQMQFQFHSEQVRHSCVPCDFETHSNQTLHSFHTHLLCFLLSTIFVLFFFLSSFEK